jgi:PPM family protein phosphatase
MANQVVSFWGISDKGKKRHNNEDACWPELEAEHPLAAFSNELLFLVADGIGGYEGGEIASRLAIDTARKHFYNRELAGKPVPERLKQAIGEANRAILKYAANYSLEEMGTTLVAAVTQPGKVTMANLGDSKAYLLRQNQPIIQITRDHNWVQEQVDAQKLTAEQAKFHPLRSLLTHSLGRPHSERALEIQELPFAGGDQLLLCSDGLAAAGIFEEEVQEVLTAFEPIDAAHELVKRANEKGGPDNITVLVIRVLPSLPAPVNLFRRIFRLILLLFIGLLAAAVLLFGLWWFNIPIWQR